MVLTNFMKATLYQYNRKTDNVYDDTVDKVIPIKICPYNQKLKERFSLYTDSEATGYYIVKGNVDIKEGDEVEFRGERHTILEVNDNWIFNKIVNITIVVK